jgi:hypothetical protein
VSTAATLTTGEQHLRLADRTPTIRLSLADGTWSEVSRTPTRTGRYEVAEAGPQSAWAIVEAGHALWQRLGEPAWDRFGVTAAPDGQHVWFDAPDSAHTWRLPDASDPAPAA